jgi:ankyrin repeat protein
MGASAAGYTDIVKLLIDAKANIDMEDKVSNNTMVKHTI